MIKKRIKTLHLWLGLPTGLLVFVIALTGSVYAFQEEIQQLTQHYRFVEQKSTPVLPPSILIPIAQQVLPDKFLHSIKYYQDHHAVEAVFYHRNPDYYYQVFIHPNTGHIQHVQNVNEGFFRWILNGHMYLWLPPDLGRVVVLIVTLIFLMMVITGLILWWPKTLSLAKPRLWFNWSKQASWKRKNWDLHAIIGFYTCAFALLFIGTGLVWVMPKFAETYHALIGGKKSMVYTEPTSPITPISSTVPDSVMDYLFYAHQNQSGFYANIDLHPPETDSSSILVVSNPSNQTYWKSDYVFYNQYTAEEIPVQHIWGKFKEANAADKLLRMNYDLHVGAIWGIPGKLLLCLASLALSTLPCTGVLIWWARKLKSYTH